MGLGLWLKRHKLLVTPEEGDPPAIALRANALQAEFAEAGFDEADGLVALHADAALRHAHDMMLPEGQPHRRGEIEPDRAVAQAKLVDAETIEDAAIWLKPKERMVVLHDRALVGLLATLPKERASA